MVEAAEAMEADINKLFYFQSFFFSECQNYAKISKALFENNMTMTITGDDREDYIILTFNSC